MGCNCGKKNLAKSTAKQVTKKITSTAKPANIRRVIKRPAR